VAAGWSKPISWISPLAGLAAVGETGAGAGASLLGTAPLGFGTVIATVCSPVAGTGIPTGEGGVGFRAGRGFTRGSTAISGGDGGTVRMAVDWPGGWDALVAHEARIAAKRLEKAKWGSRHRFGLISCATTRLVTSRRTKSAACQPINYSNLAIAINCQQLTIIEQDISLVTSVTIELSYRIARLDQQIR
jgi:hypothetical protein